MKTRFAKGIALLIFLCMPAAYAEENDAFSYFTAELVMHELDNGTGNESASGPSIRFSKSLSKFIHVRSEFTSLGFDEIDMDQKTLEVGLGLSLFNLTSNNAYIIASAKRDDADGSLPGIGNFKDHANFFTATAGYRIRSERGIEGIFELKHIQPEDDNQESGQQLEIGLRIYPPANDDISLGVRINTFESGERSGDTQEMRLFLRMDF